MKLVFSKSSWSDYLWFQDNDKKLLSRINALIKEIERLPFDGTGKPEALKANLSGFWSRRINSEHRLVYKVTDTEIIFVSFKFHYTKD
ncbi:MAG: Txe/YoeB family addiction module toxin [Methylococcaceae bacterium]